MQAHHLRPFPSVWYSSGPLMQKVHCFHTTSTMAWAFSISAGEMKYMLLLNDIELMFSSTTIISMALFMVISSLRLVRLGHSFFVEEQKLMTRKWSRNIILMRNTRWRTEGKDGLQHIFNKLFDRSLFFFQIQKRNMMNLWCLLIRIRNIHSLKRRCANWCS